MGYVSTKIKTNKQKSFSQKQTKKDKENKQQSTTKQQQN
jgi:hypothetical protein